MTRLILDERRMVARQVVSPLGTAQRRVRKALIYGASAGDDRYGALHLPFPGCGISSYREDMIARRYSVSDVKVADLFVDYRYIFIHHAYWYCLSRLTRNLCAIPNS